MTLFHRLLKNAFARYLLLVECPLKNGSFTDTLKLLFLKILHQFMHIQTLWQNVLPSNIYCKSMGTLINTTIEDAIQKVVVLDDIAADAASQLR